MHIPCCMCLTLLLPASNSYGVSWNLDEPVKARFPSEALSLREWELPVQEAKGDGGKGGEGKSNGKKLKAKPAFGGVRARPTAPVRVVLGGGKGEAHSVSK